MDLLKLFMPALFMSFAGSPDGGAVDDAAAEAELEKELGLEPEEGEEEGSEDEGKEEEGKEEKEEGKEELPEKKEDLIDDKEYDLGEMGKFKGSELKDLLDKGKDYTQKTQELSEKEKAVEELKNWGEVVKGNKKAINHLIKFSNKLVNEKGEYDEAMLDRLNAALENKVEQSKESLKAQESELERELEELDPDSPMYKVVKGSLDQIKQLQERLDEADKSAEEARNRQAETEYQNQVKAAQQVYRNTLDNLTDPEKEESLKFSNDEGKNIWHSLVSSYMKDNPKNYKDEADFVASLTEVGKACHATLSKFSEAAVAAYLKNKDKANGSEEKDKAEPEGKEERKELNIGSMDGLESAVAGALSEEMASG